MLRHVVPLCLGGLILLSGCDQLGIESATAIAAQKDAEGKAVGGGCRHAGRAIEDCYALNRKTDKAAVFAGWREMNDYMRDNKIDPVPPQVNPIANAGRAPADDAASDDGDAPSKTAKADKPGKSADKSADKSAEKGADKTARMAKPADKTAEKSADKTDKAPDKTAAKPADKKSDT